MRPPHVWLDIPINHHMIGYLNAVTTRVIEYLNAATARMIKYRDVAIARTVRHQDEATTHIHVCTKMWHLHQHLRWCDQKYACVCVCARPMLCHHRTAGREYLRGVKIPRGLREKLFALPRVRFPKGPQRRL